jgi:hypothetical protein
MPVAPVVVIGIGTIDLEPIIVVAARVIAAIIIWVIAVGAWIITVVAVARINGL